MVRGGRVAVAELAREVGAQVRKDVFADHGEHVGRGEVLEARPAEVVIGATPRVLAFREDTTLHRLPQPVRLVLLQCVQVIEATQKQEVGDLLHDLERVRDPAGPKGVPDSIDLILDIASNHWFGEPPSSDLSTMPRLAAVEGLRVRPLAMRVCSGRESACQPPRPAPVTEHRW